MKIQLKKYLELCNLSLSEFIILEVCSNILETGNIQWLAKAIKNCWKFEQPDWWNKVNINYNAIKYLKKTIILNSLIKKGYLYLYTSKHIQAISLLFFNSPYIIQGLPLPEEGDVGISPLGKVITEHFFYLLNGKIENNNKDYNKRFIADYIDSHAVTWRYLGLRQESVKYGLKANSEYDNKNNIVQCGPWSDLWWNIYPTGYTSVIGYDCQMDHGIPLQANTEPKDTTDEK
jgi:hypothetical protein